jgi:transposase InsO family protein
LGSPSYIETRLEVEIRAAHKRTRQTYGPERLQHDLKEHGVRVGICRIKRIKRKLGLRCKQKRKFKVTTDSKHSLPVAENLLGQQFKVYEPNTVWVSDITMCPLMKAGYIWPVIRTSLPVRLLVTRWGSG